MSNCKFSDNCRFYNDSISNASALQKWIRMRLCEKDCQQCARYQLASIIGEEKVPMELYPTRIDKVDLYLQVTNDLEKALRESPAHPAA